MISASQFMERKKRGLVSAVKLGTTFSIVIRKFDSETGDEIESEILEKIVLKDLELQLAFLESEVQNMKTLIQELKEME